MLPVDSSNIYDSVFKTMVHKTPKLLIPLINEAFGRRYEIDEPIVQFSEEHEGPLGTNISDSVFRIEDMVYHLECQSTHDASMVVRMIEYDFSIALQETLEKGAPYRMKFPSSCVLLLRHTSKTPDYLDMEVEMPDNAPFHYRTRVYKAQLVSEDEMFRKRLLILLPFYLMRYEKELSSMDADSESASALLRECREIRMRLADLTLLQGDELLYRQITELIIKVSDHLLAANEPLNRKVRPAMGGEILELMDDKIERLNNEKKRSREEGIQEGIQRGIQKGINQERAESAKKMAQMEKNIADRMAACGIDQATIDQVLADTNAGTPNCPMQGQDN